ncbi:MAG: hypothetical protein JJE03_07095 [Peptostreptococcaceae bacterium]|nr:hypothetical protein [Peptostreptococcaceae bacterium]
MIDFHTHILPNLDDGSSSLDMSYVMIESLKKQGAEAIVLTPHYYYKEKTIKEFITYRKEALNRLRSNEAKRKEFPDLFLGAEVAFFPMMSKMEDIEKLCITGTKYMMLEMPFGRWSRTTLEEIDNLYNAHGITPIIVHIERFVAFQKGTDNIEKLCRLDVLVQMNCEALGKRIFNKNNYNLVKNGCVNLIGSDCHNMTTRKPNLNIGIENIRKYVGSEKLQEIDNCGREVLENALKY